MALLTAFLVVTAFAVGPFISLGLMNSGTRLGVFAGLASGALYGVYFVAFVGLIMEKLNGKAKKET